MLLRRAAGALAIAVCASCAAPVAAYALEPGVHIDPGSPAGKQYGIPLWVLRGEGSGHPSPQGVPPPPLFGVGIGPASASGGTASGRSHAGSGEHSGGGRGKPRGNASAGAAGSATLTPAAIAQLTRQGSATPLVALIGAGLVALGLVVGTAVALGRRRLRGDG